MSRNDIETVVAHTRLAFSKHGRGKVVIQEGERCDRLCFLLQGELTATENADDGSYSIEETVKAPAMIQPERIFGMDQRYTRTFTTTTDCSIVSIDKKDTTRLMSEFEIFRLNILNILCTKTQRLSRQQWRKTPETIRRKIFGFIETRCLTPAGHKRLKIKMEVLGMLLGESRINVSNCLKTLENEGLLTHSRATMDIPALERLKE
ncbi:Crp/Fnr family transcriptional regulator [Prevotella koreensis]|uniref:Crp/Fnr family transcriptional regulator n=1 Tax=Prevotella koreensis TaxID=2490854 RepID=UPI0028EB6100|nr:Crp/Fnr family transcriptional regulator [Prevotella koreensis]